MATIRWCPIFPKWDSYQPLSLNGPNQGLPSWIGPPRYIPANIRQPRAWQCTQHCCDCGASATASRCRSHGAERYGPAESCLEDALLKCPKNCPLGNWRCEENWLWLATFGFWDTPINHLNFHWRNQPPKPSIAKIGIERSPGWWSWDLKLFSPGAWTRKVQNWLSTDHWKKDSVPLLCWFTCFQLVQTWQPTHQPPTSTNHNQPLSSPPKPPKPLSQKHRRVLSAKRACDSPNRSRRSWRISAGASVAFMARLSWRWWAVAELGEIWGKIYTDRWLKRVELQTDLGDRSHLRPNQIWSNIFMKGMMDPHRDFPDRKDRTNLLASHGPMALTHPQIWWPGDSYRGHQWRRWCVPPERLPAADDCGEFYVSKTWWFVIIAGSLFRRV